MSDRRPGRRVTGWDVGGANLKGAVVENGRVVAAAQAPCPLWKGLDRLAEAFAALAPQLGPYGGSRHAVTMTGELTDLFETRAQGVASIAAAAVAHLGDALLFDGALVPPARVADRAQAIAAANWRATALWCARALPAGLLLDMGSTTTDVVPFAHGRVLARGHDDTARLLAGELVYTGLTRTPVMAFGPDAPFAGARVPLMAEFFATAADVHRLAGTLPPDPLDRDTADGRPATLADSAGRLARMIGRDRADAGLGAFRAMAQGLAARQAAMIAGAAERVATAAGLPADAPVVTAGAGSAVVTALARRLGRPAVAFPALVPSGEGPGTPGPDLIATCAPAVALALLAAQDRTI